LRHPTAWIVAVALKRFARYAAAAPTSESYAGPKKKAKKPKGKKGGGHY
jgi:hypothetical protein